jgi:hypothetical protein
MMCDECLAIAQDLKEAFAELLIRRTGRPEASRVVDALRSGTEEDALMVEEFFSTRGQEAGPRMMRAMDMKLAHERRTGHTVRLPLPGR